MSLAFIMEEVYGFLILLNLSLLEQCVSGLDRGVGRIQTPQKGND